MPRPKPRIETTPEEHKARHVELHKALDELLADYLTHCPTRRLTNSSLLELVEWSHAQTRTPTERTQ